MSGAEVGKLFGKGPDSNSFRLCEPHSLYLSFSTLPSD